MPTNNWITINVFPHTIQKLNCLWTTCSNSVVDCTPTHRTIYPCLPSTITICTPRRSSEPAYRLEQYKVSMADSRSKLHKPRLCRIPRICTNVAHHHDPTHLPPTRFQHQTRKSLGTGANRPRSSQSPFQPPRSFRHRPYARATILQLCKSLHHLHCLLPRTSTSPKHVLPWRTTYTTALEIESIISAAGLRFAEGKSPTRRLSG